MAHRPLHGRARPHRGRRAGSQPDHRGPHRGLDRRLEGVRARGHAGSPTTAWSSAPSRTSTRWGPHRGLDHRRPGPDGCRTSSTSDAQRRLLCIRRVGVETGDRTCSSPRPRHGGPGDHRDEPAGVTVVRAGLEYRLDRQDRERLAVGYTLDEIPNDITRRTPASFEPSIDYVVTKVPRWAFEKLPGTSSAPRCRAWARPWPSVGRFPKSLQKALRSPETGRAGLNADPANPRTAR